MNVVMAAGIFDEISGLGNELKTLLGSVVLVVMYLVSIISTWGATRSVLKAFAAAVGGAVVLGVVASQTVLSDKTAEELKEDHSAHASVVRVDEGHRGE